jgi:hypothetical protein
MHPPRPFETYDPQKGDPYPEVAYEDVMSKDAVVLEWMEKIVSRPQKFQRLSHSTGLLIDDFGIVDLGLLLREGRPRQPGINQNSHRENRFRSAHTLWYIVI